MFAVDLEGIQGLMATRIARRFKVAKGAILKAAEERAGVIDFDLFDLPR